MSKKAAIFILPLLILGTSILLAADGNYRIGPGDVLHVTVYDEPDLERTVTVQENGIVRFPLVRRVKLEGLTVADAERELEKLLGESYLVDPQVTITIKEYRAHLVYVLGAVKTPGLYALTGSSTVLEILSKAGGITEDGSRRLLVVRGGGNPAKVKRLLEAGGEPDREALTEAGLNPPIIIDGARLLDEGDTSQNLTLQDGDVLYIPKMKKVYVLGEVHKPGAVNFTEGLTVIKAISLAGGTTQMASNTIQVTRKVDGREKRFKLNLKKILRDTNLDLVLEPDDVIVVKRSLF